MVFQITDATLGLFALHCPRLSVLVSKLLSSRCVLIRYDTIVFIIEEIEILTTKCVI